MLTKLSASSIDGFDNESTFGCQSKWWFEYVKGYKVEDPSTQLGTLVHSSIEAYLLTGVNGLHKVALSGKHLIDEVKPRLFSIGGKPAIEHWFDKGVEYEGVPLRGKIDAIALFPVGPDFGFEIVDWKTTSSIERYAKTASQAKESTQLICYADWFFSWLQPEEQNVKVSLIYFQTKGRNSEKVSAIISRQHVAERRPRIIELVKQMRAAAVQDSPKDLKPDTSKCNIGKGCPHKSYCPHFNPLGFNLEALKPKENTMGLLDIFMTETQPEIVIPAPPANVPPPAITAPAATPPAITAPARPANVMPPALPPEVEEATTEETTLPEDFQPVPPPKRGPGRPRRALVRDDSPPEFKYPAPPVVSQTAKTVETPVITVTAPKKDATPAPTVTRLVVRHGLTINTGNYNSARVEVEMEMTGAVDRTTLSTMVREALYDEAKVYIPKKEETK